MIFATFFGSLILTNLLIALMATEYEDVSEKAAEEVMCNKIELAYDLSHRSRLMPPPLNTLVFIQWGMVWWFNFIRSVINPKDNLYAYLNYHSFQKLKESNPMALAVFVSGYMLNAAISVSIWMLNVIAFVCWMCHETASVLRSHLGTFLYAHCSEHPAIIDKLEFIGWILSPCLSVIESLYQFLLLVPDVMPSLYAEWHVNATGNRASNYFLNMSRAQVLKWFLLRLFPRFVNEEDIKRIHHRACYGYLIMHGKNKSKSLHAVNGMSMTDYMDKFQRKHNKNINQYDKARLKHLTPNALFCGYCGQPYSANNYEDELASPEMALLDLLSAITFSVVVYVPLIIGLGVLTIFDEFQSWLEGGAKQQKYTPADFNREYFPSQLSNR